MAAFMKFVDNPVFDNQDRIGGSSSSSPSHSPPLPSHNLHSEQTRAEKSLELDEEGFQPVRNRRSKHSDYRSASQGNQPIGNGSNQAGSYHRNPAQFRKSIGNGIKSGSRPATDARNLNKASSWAELLKKGGLNSDFDLGYIAPLSMNEKKIVVVNEEAGKRTENKWSHSVIAYVFGDRPVNPEISKLGDHLVPVPRKTVSQHTIQNAVRLVSSSSPPANKKKKKRSKHKNMKDIMGSDITEDVEDADFREKYITSNKKWDCLKIKNKQNYKKKGRKLDIREDEDSYSDSL